MEIPEKERLTEKTVLITGSANGLGRALADKFLSERWKVIATDKDFPSLTELNVNPHVLAIKMDVTSDEEVQAAFERTRAEDLRLDLIINNAGIDSYFPFSEAPVGKFREVFETNVFGAYRVNQVFLPLLKEPGGRIIHIGSESLNVTAPFMPYPISKNALERYAKVLRQELKFNGIDVVVIRPGAIRTKILENVMNLQSGVAGKSLLLQKQLKKFAEIAPKNIGKVLEPEEVAAFVYKVSQKTNPKVVYRINNNPMLKIMALLPFSLIEKAVRKQLSG
jgi:NAD(P)-dependent dehydrogenase (short-subunit alcohol dehydrogenase family)